VRSSGVRRDHHHRDHDANRRCPLFSVPETR